MILQPGTFYWHTTLPNAPQYPSLEENAVRHIKLCQKAIDHFEKACSICPLACSFVKRDH